MLAAGTDAVARGRAGPGVIFARHGDPGTHRGQAAVIAVWRGVPPVPEECAGVRAVGEVRRRGSRQVPPRAPRTQSTPRTSQHHSRSSWRPWRYLAYLA